jgi:hypothetical protein
MTTVLALAGAATAARAQQLEEVGETRASGSRIGLGVEAVLASPFPGGGLGGGPTGALALSYDMSKFRIDGLLYLLFVEDVGTTFALGGRFFYVVDSGRVADFSVGGGLSLGILAPDNSDSTVGVGLEGAAQLRVFLASNVALSGTVGLGVAFGHSGSFLFTLGGQLTGALGIVYYF